jgi:dTDP-4-dehydrorhamnose 3,5-epimerase
VRFIETVLPGVIVVEPEVFRDPRGFFLEVFHAQKYREGGIDAQFVQDNHSRSSKGTLRGLHAQLKRPQGKLVRAVKGEILDVAVDIRPRSPTFGQHVTAMLNDENFRQMYVPPGFAHGFCVLSDVAEVEYKCTDFYDKSDEIGVRWDTAGIDWPIREPLLSMKDATLPSLDELRRMLER